jgi:hypothetical protein
MEIERLDHQRAKGRPYEVGMAISPSSSVAGLVLDAGYAHILFAPRNITSFRPDCSRGIGPTPALKVMMTPKFLREEAARFRGMAGTTDLEASKVRLLAMAIDFEARATAADNLIEPKPDEFIEVRDEVIKAKASRKIAITKEPSEVA